MIRRAFVIALPAVLMVSGCFKSSPAVVFHTLSTLENQALPQSRPMALEIMPVQIPDLLQRSQIVIQNAPGVYRLAEFHWWGNTLERDMQRVLGENLSNLLGSDPVVSYPDGSRVKARYRIALDVHQLDGEPGGTLLFKGTWMITRWSDSQMVLLRKTEIQEAVKGGTVEDLVSAHDRVMASLSREIAGALLALPD